MSDVYRRLGLRSLINADTTLTLLGGSLMPAPVLDAMREAATAYVDVAALEAAVSQRIAVLTQNEAALVTSGAATGLFLCAIGAQAGSRRSDALAWERDFRAGGGVRREIVVQAAQRNPYDLALSLAGVDVVQVGSVMHTDRADLEAALGPRTAAIVHLAGAHLAQGALPFLDVLDVGRSAGVPVIVDAAAQLPPRDNLWSFTRAGATAVVFSGGKGLRGPAPTGLVLGSATFLDACRLHAYPQQRLGRPMKVGKEELAGILAAVEWYLEQDETAAARRCEAVVAAWAKAIGELPGVTARRDFPGEAGRPLPRLLVSLETDHELDGAGLREALLEHDPPVAVAVADEGSVHLNPELLEDGEADVVLAAVLDILTGPKARAPRPAHAKGGA